jgi:hypothetical protein
MLPCPTDLALIRTQVLDGLKRMQTALGEAEAAWQLEPGSERNSRLDQALRAWDSVSSEQWDCAIHFVPRRVREALPGIYDQNQRKKGLFIWLKDLRNPDGSAEAEVFPHQPDIHTWLRDHPEAQLMLPDIGKRIREAEQVFDKFDLQGVEDFAPKIAEVQQIVLDEVSMRNRAYHERAEDPEEATEIRLLGPGLANHRPLRGLPDDELVSRVQDIEPAAGEPLILAAADVLRRAGRIEQIDVADFQSGAVKDEQRRVWVLAEGVSPKQGLSVEAVRQNAEDRIQRGVLWPGRNNMAKVVGCSPNTMRKAIEQSPILQKAVAVAKKRRPARRPKAQAFTAQTEARQRRGDTAVDEAVENDEILNSLLAQCQDPAEKAKIRAMPPEKRRAIAETYREQQADDQLERLNRKEV